ncbi:UNVERIFIED_CONTAM: hypothetical protein K2H54_024830 [Gekko kuhli]
MERKQEKASPRSSVPPGAMCSLQHRSPWDSLLQQPHLKWTVGESEPRIFCGLGPPISIPGYEGLAPTPTYSTGSGRPTEGLWAALPAKGHGGGGPGDLQDATEQAGQQNDDGSGGTG